MSDTIYLGRDGQQMGPYAWAQIAAMASSGQVRAGDLAWHDGMPNWQPAEQVLTRLGLSLAAATTPPLSIAPAPARRAAAKPVAEKAVVGFGSRLARLLPGKAAAKI